MLRVDRTTRTAWCTSATTRRWRCAARVLVGRRSRHGRSRTVTRPVRWSGYVTFCGLSPNRDRPWLASEPMAGWSAALDRQADAVGASHPPIMPRAARSSGGGSKHLPRPSLDRADRGICVRWTEASPDVRGRPVDKWFANLPFMTVWIEYPANEPSVLLIDAATSQSRRPRPPSPARPWDRPRQAGFDQLNRRRPEGPVARNSHRRWLSRRRLRRSPIEQRRLPRRPPCGAAWLRRRSRRS